MVSATGIFITNLTYLRTISRVVVPLALALESAYTPRPIEKPQINWGVSIGAGEGTLTPGLVLGKDAL